MRAKKKLEENILVAKDIYLENKSCRYFYKNEIKIPKKSLVLLCGTPGSGKTTVARKMCRQLNNSSHINIDYWFDCSTKELFPNAEYVTTEEINSIAKDAFDKAYRSAEEALEKENIVVWDDLEIFPTDRAEVLNRLKDKYAYVILVVVNCDKEKAIMRLINRGNTYNRIKLVQDTHMYLQLQIQKPSKYFIGFDEVYIIDEAEEITVKEP